jgi:hypothetical protein
MYTDSQESQRVALRAYPPAGTTVVEVAPGESWAIVGAASDDDDVEANWRGALT